MRVTSVLFLLSALVLLLPTHSEAQFRRNTVPTIPPPTITEYNPRSTLVVPEHEVPHAKFPAVDLHGHPPTLNNPEAINLVISAMDELQGEGIPSRYRGPMTCAALLLSLPPKGTATGNRLK